MTAITKIINCGNHPGDWVEIKRWYGVGADNSRLTKAVLHRGDYCVLHPGERAEISSQHHGDGDGGKEHDAFAICTEGPGAKTVRTDFDPSDLCKVERIKKLAAALMNEVEHIELIDDNACLDLMHAQSKAEEAILIASMLSVYAATVEAK